MTRSSRAFCCFLSPRIFYEIWETKFKPSFPIQPCESVNSFWRGKRNVLKINLRERRCGEMADATDLKSVPAKAGYGFESHHRHPRKRDFDREKCQNSPFSRFRMFAHGNARIDRLFANYSSSESSKGDRSRGWVLFYWRESRVILLSENSLKIEIITPKCSCNFIHQLRLLSANTLDNRRNCRHNHMLGVARAFSNSP